ncbi:MAG: YdbH domain-containing protein [Candidatus Omnitrophota bacterium]
MKRHIRVVFVLLFILGVYYLSVPGIVSYVKKRLVLFFPGAQVSIGGCSLDVLHRLAFSDIRIINPSAFDFRIKRLTVEYDLNCLLKAKINRVSFDGPYLSIHAPAQEIADLKKHIRLSPGKGVFVGEAVVSSAGIDIRTKDLVCAARFSCEADVPRKSFSSFRFELDSLESKGVRIDGVLCSLAKGARAGEITLRSAGYQKLTLSGLTGKLLYENQALSFTSLSADCLGGKIFADINLNFEKAFSYEMRINVVSVDLARLIRDLELSDKVQMSGFVEGGMSCSGENAVFQSVRGDFSVVTPGGTLTIKDTRFLEHIAQNSKQSVGFVSDAFKDYLFNTGGMRISLEGADLISQVSLNGAKGKRDFTVALRDFSLQDLLTR